MSFNLVGDFRQEVSLSSDQGASFYIGEGAPSADADIGSTYRDLTSGHIYQKNASGAGADKWIRQANTNDLLAIKFRSEKVVAATGDVAPASGSSIDLVANPFGDDEAPLLVAADFVVGNHIIFGVGGTPKLMRVSAVNAPEITVVDADDALEAQDKFVVQNFLPDSPGDQEVQALVEYTGSDIIKIGDVNWNFADGIGMATTYAAASGNVTSADTVNSAIQKIDGNVDALEAAVGVAQGATDMGAYTGNILTDGQSAKENIQELSDAIESVVKKSEQLGVTAEVTLDEILVDDFESAKWFVTCSLVSDRSNKRSYELFAMHNGHVGADASAVDGAPYNKLKLGAEFTHSISVDVSGIGAAQVMRLRVSASAAVDFKATRLSVE